MKTNKEKIIERLTKLKTMRDHGENGERTNAAILMDEIMRKHGITEEDLEQDEETIFWLFIPDSLHLKLFVQMITMVKGEKTTRLVFFPETKEEDVAHLRMNLEVLIPKSEKYNTIGYAKKSEFAEAMARYNMYKGDFDKNIDRFYYAYLYKNDLFGKSEESEDDEWDEEKMNDLRKSIMMARSMDRAKVFRQLREGGNQ